MTASEPSVFTRIINGEIPGRFVYRDDSVVAFLTIEPIDYGHVLVVPVEQVDRWTDLDPQVWAHVCEIAQIVGKAVVDFSGAPRAGVIIAGFEVPHTHVHVFPASDMSGYNLGSVIPMDQTDPELMDRAQSEISRIVAELLS